MNPELQKVILLCLKFWFTCLIHCLCQLLLAGELLLECITVGLIYFKPEICIFISECLLATYEGRSIGSRTVLLSK